MRIFFDMDGTLAEWRKSCVHEDFYQKGYFSSLLPYMGIVEAAKNLQEQGYDVYIISAVLTDSAYALDEKKEWLKKWLPSIPEENYIFPPCGREKKDYVPGGVLPSDILVDDYTLNLQQWPGIGIKVENPFNCLNGSCHKYKISIYDDNIAEKIKKVC